MSSLLDVGPLTEEVTVRGTKVTCYGVSAGGLFYLINNYPEIRSLMERKVADLNVEDLLEKAQSAISAVIAIGTTDPEEYTANTKEWKEVVLKAASRANTLGVSDQLNAVSAIFRLTFPEGTGPFVTRINAMTEAFNTTMTTPTTESVTKSPARSNASFQTDSVGIARGAVRRDN
jgi:hypothetical protein